MLSIKKSSRRLGCCAVAALFYATTPKLADAGTILFEDSWPNASDLDFNDQVVAYNYDFTFDKSGKVTQLQATYNVLAIGASLHNGLYLHLPVPQGAGSATIDLGNGQGAVAAHPDASESELVFPIVTDTRSLFPNAQSGLINTTPGQPRITGSTVEVDVNFTQPVQLDIAAAPFDLYIARTDEPGHQIHQSQYPGTGSMDTSLFDTGDDASSASAHFINANGLPFALTIPSDAAPLGDPNLGVYAGEGTSILSAYPLLATNGGASTDWYDSPDKAYLYTAAPEPAAFSLAAIGAVGLLAVRRRTNARG